MNSDNVRKDFLDDDVSSDIVINEEIAAKLSDFMEDSPEVQEQFKDYLASDSEFKGKIPNPVTPQNVIAGISYAGSKILSGKSANEIKQEVINDVKALAGDKISQFTGSSTAGGSGTFNVGKSSIPGSGDSGPPKGGQRGGSGGRVPFNLGLLNMNPVPVKVNLTTPIIPNCYPEYFLDSHSIEHSRLVVSCMDFNPFNNLNFSAFERFSSMLMSQIQLYSQNSVKFRISLLNFTEAKLINYFKDLTDALLLFYYYTSILEYCQPKYKHTNQGIFDLADSLDPFDLERLYELTRYLELYPIPPRLNEYCWFLMQNYKASENPGSTLIRFIPVTPSATAELFLTPETFTESGNINTAINRLNSDDNKKVVEILSSAAPNWLKTNVVGSTGATIYSPNFSTIFGNSPAVYGDFRPSNSGQYSVDIDYGVWGGRLDGLAYALTCIFDASTGSFMPSLSKPLYNSVYGRLVNRFIYAKDDTGPKFYTVQANLFAALNTGLFVYSPFNDTQWVTSAPAAAEYRLGVNVRSISESATQTLEWLLSFDTMGSANSDLPNKKIRRNNRGGRTSNMKDGNMENN